MDYNKKIKELVFKEPEEVFEEFLNTLKSAFLDYLNGKVNEVTISKMTVLWYVAHDEFSNSLIKINPRIKDLGSAMDITHPDFSNSKKRAIIEGLVKKIDEILLK